MSSQKIDRLARVEEGDSNRSEARRVYRASHHGEGTRGMLDRDEGAFIHQSLSTPCLNVLEGCEGPYLRDGEGRRILDFHGNGTHALGFAHPRVVKAVVEQLGRLPFCTRRYTNEPAIRLAERLGGMLPEVEGGWRVLLAPAGCLAVGVALKAARLITGRYKMMGMWGSFHGSSLDAISLGGERMFRDGMGPLLPGNLHAHPWSPGRSVEEALGEVDRVFRSEGEVGVLVAEAIRWSTITIPPVEYWRGVREMCDREGTLLVFDEIGTCMGRTGRWHAFERYGVVPDGVVLGKALGGGVMPLAAVAIQGRHVRPELTGEMALGHYTHEKNPLGAVAALAAMEVIEEERLVERAEWFGRECLEMLRSRLGGLRGVKSVRGLGMMFAVELEDEGHAERVMYASLRAGLSYKVSAGRVLTLVAPINLEESDMRFAVEVLEKAIGMG